jgi:hypothetical protein
VAAVWLVLAVHVVEASELGNTKLAEWVHRINWTQTVGGARLYWGNKDERTIMAAEALALLMAMTQIWKALASVQLVVRTVLPIDNEAVVRKMQIFGLRPEKKSCFGLVNFVLKISEVTASTRRCNICTLAKLRSVRHSKFATANWYADKWAKAYT